jgi:hypothetical protein
MFQVNKEKTKAVVRRIEEYGCTDLAAKLVKRQGIESPIELRGSLNGLRLQNPHRQAVAALVREDLQGKGFEVTARTVDIAFKAAGASIRPAERDKLAHMLHVGILRKR